METQIHIRIQMTIHLKLCRFEDRNKELEQQYLQLREDKAFNNNNNNDKNINNNNNNNRQGGRGGLSQTDSSAKDGHHT